MFQAQAKTGKLLLSLADHTPIQIDHRSQMTYTMKWIEPVALCNNAALVEKAAKVSFVSKILTTVASKAFSGPIFNEIKSVFP